MNKAHVVQQIVFKGNHMHIIVDGKEHVIDIVLHSKRLAKATEQQRTHYTISPSEYGIHWPDIDEDLSIDGLLGIKHEFPSRLTTEGNRKNDNV